MQVGSINPAPMQLDHAGVQQANLSEPEIANSSTSGKHARCSTAIDFHSSRVTCYVHCVCSDATLYALFDTVLLDRLRYKF